MQPEARFLLLVLAEAFKDWAPLGLVPLIDSPGLNRPAPRKKLRKRDNASGEVSVFPIQQQTSVR